MSDALLLPGTDDLSRGLYSTARVFASSASLQSLLGVDSVAEALAAIHYKEANGDEARPIVCVSPMNAIRYQLQAGGTGNFLRPAGEVWVYIAADPPTEVLEHEETVKAQEIWAAKTFGAIALDVVNLAGVDQTEDEDVTDSHPSIITLTLQDFSCVPEEYRPEYGNFWWAIYSIQWGDG